MKTLDQLILYHKERLKQCRGEIERCAEMFNKNRAFTEDDCKRCTETWTEEAAFARDTVSYLEWLNARHKKPKPESRGKNGNRNFY